MTSFTDINGVPMVPLKGQTQKQKETKTTQEKENPTLFEITRTKKINIYRNRLCHFGSECRFINKINQKTGHKCDFAHSEDELNTLSRQEEVKYTVSTKSQVCKFRQFCNKSDCVRAHTPEELVLQECHFGEKCFNTECTFTHPRVKIDKKIVFEMKIQEIEAYSLLKEMEERFESGEDDSIPVKIDYQKEKNELPCLSSKQKVWNPVIPELTGGTCRTKIVVFNIKKVGKKI